MTEARGTTVVGPSWRFPAAGRGLEGALAVSSCPLRDLLEERHLLPNRSPVAFYSLCKEPGLALCSLHDWLLLLRLYEMLRSLCEKILLPSNFEVLCRRCQLLI